MAKKEEKMVETPLMKQYYAIKAQYPDAILLFRIGDFYETFGEDAVTTAKVLGIVLTKRANGSAAFIDLAGFPHHSLDSYLPKLVRAGHRVAICEQLEDPKMTKTIVKRGVTELVTPGVTLNDNVLQATTNNFLCSICFTDGELGVAFLDISTGEFLAGEGSVDYVANLLQSFQPSEILYQKNQATLFKEVFGSNWHLHGVEPWIFEEDFTRELLLKQFGTHNLKGFGIEELKGAQAAAGAILHYLGEAQHSQLQHLNVITRLSASQHVWMDNFTIRNLELVHAAHPQALTLSSVLDRTISPMGARLLRRWLVMPLKDIAQIKERQNCTEYVLQHEEWANLLREHLKEIGDLERLTARIATARISPRDVVQLMRALTHIAHIRDAGAQAGNTSIVNWATAIHACDEVRARIAQEIDEQAPALVNKGNVFKAGVNAELDELRTISTSGKEYLLNLQKREVEITGIPSLKVAFNNVFGYYIEVTNAHKAKVPDTWIRKQTLVNAERYITEELKEYESKILGAEEKMLAIETRLFGEFIQYLQQFVPQLQANARLVANMDVLQSFAKIAGEFGYFKPEVNEGTAIRIREGRHPVIERTLPVGETYVPNDIDLSQNDQQIIIITGPNMSGKSAILRQTAIIVLMAQMGAFVPAKEAQIGIVDRIFTRVGASDNLSQGESTFMVEMNETASILNNLSDRSLILLDEIGRGTSTYDGISIAWSIAEYLHNHPKFKPLTLFATHYHELNEMATTMQRIKNMNVAVKELTHKVVFLRKLQPGGSAHSFGIHVAKMAGMPKEVVQRAQHILKDLEKVHHGASTSEMPVVASSLAGQSETNSGMQLSFFQLDDPVLMQIREEIQALDINQLTPVEALMKLNEIKKIVGVKS